MTNTITLGGKLLSEPSVRSFEARKGKVEVVSLWMEVQGHGRRDRFKVDIFCPRQQQIAKAIPEGALVEVTGSLRHDRWRDLETKEYRGKIYVAIEPSEGTVRSKGMAEAALDDVAA
ncbi:hypothetical protein [Vitreimonas flagellata]|uniref:hypothetical protein n=1 Tax=Vitreimonas flagellata TaxID=2560861 RepID=UPI0010757FFE|nr:hypothetical protein [Vitreimonas flagellata]